MPCSFAQLKSGADLIVGEENLKMNILMQKSDYMTSTLFTERAGAALSEALDEFLETKKLKGLEDVWPHIAESSNAVKKYLIDNYLNEDGIIDSDRLHDDFPDMEAVEEVMIPLLDQTKKQASEMLQSFKEQHYWRQKVSQSIDASSSRE